MKTFILLMLLGGVAIVKTAAHVNDALVNDGEVDLEDLISTLFDGQDDNEIINPNKKQHDQAFDSAYGLTKGKVLETIPVLAKIWSLSVDIKPVNKTNGWSNIIHASQGDDIMSYGDRIPGIWFRGSSNKLHICSAVNGNVDYCYDPDTPLSPNVFTNVKIEQRVDHVQGYIYSIYVGGRLVHQVTNSKIREFKNVKVYASDPWYPAAAAVIRNYNFDNGYSLIKGKILENIPLLPKIWTLSVDIKPLGTINGRTNIIHVTGGGDTGSYGDRNPGIWFISGTNQLYICSAVNGYDNYCHSPVTPLPPNVFTNVKVEQQPHMNSYTYSIFVGGTKTLSVINKVPSVVPNVKVYGSDPWHPAAAAVIRNYQFDYAFSLEKGKIVQSIPVLTKSWSLSVDIKPFGKRGAVTNIIHATRGGNIGTYGDRTPGIWFVSGTNQLYICSAVNGDDDYCYTPVTPLPLNVFTNVKVEQKPHGGSHIYYIYVGGSMVRSVRNYDARVIPNVKVYGSDPWHYKAAAVIRNYKFEVGNSNDDVDEQGDKSLLKEVFDYAYGAYVSSFEE